MKGYLYSDDDITHYDRKGAVQAIKEDLRAEKQNLRTILHDEFNWFKHLIVPVIGFILMIPAFLGVLGGVTIPILDVELAPLGEPYSFVPPLVGVWMLIGIVIGLYFWFRERDKLRSVREAMGESEDEAPVPAPAT